MDDCHQDDAQFEDWAKTKRQQLAKGVEMKTQHTLGPWFPEITEKGTTIIKTKGKDLKHGFLAELQTVDSGEEEEANARLIAAAPEILQSLQKLLDKLPNDLFGWEGDSTNPAFNEALSAIHKATDQVFRHES